MRGTKKMVIVTTCEHVKTIDTKLLSNYMSQSFIVTLSPYLETTL